MNNSYVSISKLEFLGGKNGTTTSTCNIQITETWNNSTFGPWTPPSSGGWAPGHLRLDLGAVAVRVRRGRRHGTQGQPQAMRPWDSRCTLRRSERAWSQKDGHRWNRYIYIYSHIYIYCICDVYINYPISLYIFSLRWSEYMLFGWIVLLTTPWTSKKITEIISHRWTSTTK